MSISPQIEDRELGKFRECPEGSGEVVVAVKVCDTPPVVVEENPGLPDGYVSISEYGQAVSIASATPTTIHSYTVPVGKKLILDKVECGGENIATYTIKLNATVNAVKRSYWTEFNIVFNYAQYELAAGETILVEVEHNRPDVSSHEARIIGVLG